MDCFESKRRSRCQRTARRRPAGHPRKSQIHAIFANHRHRLTVGFEEAFQVVHPGNALGRGVAELGDVSRVFELRRDLKYSSRHTPESASIADTTNLRNATEKKR